MFKQHFQSSFRFMILFCIDVIKKINWPNYTHELLELSDFGSVLNENILIIN